MSQFITAIGTDCGKTFVTCLLVRQLLARGITPHPLKPIMSGYQLGQPHDVALMAACLGESEEEALQKRMFAGFAMPASPHLAARAEGKEIDEAALIGWTKAQLFIHPHCLIEGAGGLMVPINKHFLMIDFIGTLSLPVILVASSYLGAMNHSLLSIQALQQRHIPIAGVIVSEAPSGLSAGLVETMETLQDYHPEISIIALPRISAQSTWKDAPDLLPLIV